MIPSEYRLEQVTARLAHRLEGTRRSFVGDKHAAAAAFERVANEVVDHAIAEFRVDGFVDHPDEHAAFLRSEVMQTFLPRYTRMATEMNQREASGFGLGFLYGTLGRVVLVMAALVMVALLFRSPGSPVFKVLAMVPLFIGPFIPDFVSYFARRRYHRELMASLKDQKLIQDGANDYRSPVH
ncbi:MAG: hypothetical protein AB8H79_19455 [Myxococcota bacterium]